MRIHRTIWGNGRSDHPPSLLQITSSPRSLPMTVDLDRHIAAGLQPQGFGQEDLFISITPTQLEDWSSGHAEAQSLQG
jgi:hypothetical protein